ncbi:MAG: NADH-quinone oxidoreductase subunit L, partial [Burkholderiales bacterium]
MGLLDVLFSAGALTPAALMLVAALLPWVRGVSVTGLWRAFIALSAVAVLATGVTALAESGSLRLPAALLASPLSMGLALLVQLLGTVIAAFSARYLEGEAGQRRYVSALAGVLAAVHLLLLADHWVILIMAWAL